MRKVIKIKCYKFLQYFETGHKMVIYTDLQNVIIVQTYSEDPLACLVYQSNLSS